MKKLFISKYSNRKDPLLVGLDPGRRMTGRVGFVELGGLGVVVADRPHNEDLCDWLWETPILKVVMEDWRVYPSALSSLRWNELKEVRLIGAVEEICRRRKIPLVLVQPSRSKQLVPNQILKALGTFPRNQHTADAFRVVWTVMLFGEN